MHQTITRKGTIDIAHRVMDENMKCFNVHGHCYMYELTFGFNQTEDIGYAIDFKEIKRVGCQWLDDYLDHGSILNPKDVVFIDAVKALDSKLWLMSLNGQGEYCNPSVENVAKEIFLAQKILFADNYKHLWIEHLRLFETPNCYTDCYNSSISTTEENNFNAQNMQDLIAYREAKGVVEYDQRKKSI